MWIPDKPPALNYQFKLAGGTYGVPRIEILDHTLTNFLQTSYHFLTIDLVSWCLVEQKGNQTVMQNKPQLLAVLALALATSVTRAEQIKVTTALGRPVLLADERQTTYLKIGLTGFSGTVMERRTPVNVAIVLDRSGSMAGEKLRKTKEAASLAIDRLNSDDIVSVIAFDDKVQVLVPATKVADRASINDAIAHLTPGGSTALFAGVSKGAAEVRKFLDRQRMNRIILLSDGIANVGPSSPSELGDLGASLIKEGISVTTIGVGADFNEDLMTQLARRSDGNHGFAETAQDIARLFNAEFGDILSVVAQEVTVRVRCGDGIRPIRTLGREADITGQTVITTLNQLYANHQKFIMLEVEIPATADGRSRDIASVEVSYANMATHETDRLRSSVAARFTSSQRQVLDHENTDVMAAAIELIAVINNDHALSLRDAGKINEARAALIDNSVFLDSNAERYKSDKLRGYKAENLQQAAGLSNEVWSTTRKGMRGGQYSREQQQSY